MIVRICFPPNAQDQLLLSLYRSAIIRHVAWKNLTATRIHVMGALLHFCRHPNSELCFFLTSNLLHLIFRLSKGSLLFSSRITIPKTWKNATALRWQGKVFQPVESCSICWNSWPWRSTSGSTAISLYWCWFWNGNRFQDPGLSFMQASNSCFIWVSGQQVFRCLLWFR